MYAWRGLDPARLADLLRPLLDQLVPAPRRPPRGAGTEATPPPTAPAPGQEPGASR